jgi:hypothetical protein
MISSPRFPRSSVSRTRCLRALLGAAIALVAARDPASALTADEIDRGASAAGTGLMSITERLAADDFDGRNNDSPTTPRVERYLISRLRLVSEGLDPAGLGAEAYRQPFVQNGQRGTNLLGIIPGREAPEEVVIVGAHYDHVKNCGAAPAGGACNGATDNATGVAAVLAIGRALTRLPEPPRRSVVLALWDAEEDGLLGSRYYVDHPLVSLENTVAYINFDILGATLLPSLEQFSFAIGAETGGADFAELVQWAIDQEHLDTKRLSFIFGQLRSDYANFVDVGVPTVFFSDSTGACYHTQGDDLTVVNEGKLRMQSRIAFRLTAALAEELPRPHFAEPNPGLATYEDAVALADVIGSGMDDLRVFPKEDRADLVSIAEDMEAIAEAGPEAFGPEDATAAVGAAAATIDALTGLECPLPSRPPRSLGRIGP